MPAADIAFKCSFQYKKAPKAEGKPSKKFNY
jgi:hypothetical protein